LQAIWREAAAKPEDPVSPDTPRSHVVGPAARAIADKSRSYGLRPASKALANKFAPTEVASFSRSASVNARELSGSRFCRRRRSLACRRSGAKRQPNLKIRFLLTLLGRLMSGPLRAPSRTSRAPTACGQNQNLSRTSSLLQGLCRSRDPLLSTRGNYPGNRFCRRRRSLACRRSAAQPQPNLKIRFRLPLLDRMMSGLRPESKALANKFAPTGPVSLARSASVNARELYGSRFCRKRRSPACRRSGAQRQQNS